MKYQEQQQIGITFPANDVSATELYNWIISQKHKPQAWLGREAFECLRLFGSFAAAQQAAKALEWIKQNQPEVLNNE